jgi:hypothetical protein
MTQSITAQSPEEIQRLGTYLAQWRLGNLKGPSSDVRKGQRYLLKNTTNRHFLHYKHQGTFGGINLGFTDDAEPSTAAKVVQWELVNRHGTPVKFDEPVALRCRDDYLRYGQREIGINLHWSDNPVYEWRLLGGKPGTALKTGVPFSIFNMHNADGEPLIYFQREIGGNIGWPSSKTLIDQGFEWAKDAAQKAIAEYLKSVAGGK